MARKTPAKAKSKAKTKSKVSKKPVASAAHPRTHRIVESTTFRSGKTGRVIHLALKTKPIGKVITASVGGRVKSIAISR